MDLSRVDADLQKPTARLSSLPIPLKPWALRLMRAGSRLVPAARVDGVTVEVVADAGVRVRVYRPTTRRSSAALLWIHGGGYVIGDAKTDDRHCSDTAAALGIVVVSLEYQLAPEHPFPTQLDEAHAAWCWLLANVSTLGADAGRLAIGGHSAGGGLATSLAQRLHDEGGPQPCAQWLFCPMLDDRTAANASLDALDHFVWNNARNRFAWRAYLGQEPGSERAPEYSVPARRADLSGLPPAWLNAGSLELFREEVVAYAERLRAAGVPTVYCETPGAPHGFETWAIDTPPAQAINARAREWLDAAIARSGTVDDPGDETHCQPYSTDSPQREQ